MINFLLDILEYLFYALISIVMAITIIQICRGIYHWYGQAKIRHNYWIFKVNNKDFKKWMEDKK